MRRLTRRAATAQEPFWQQWSWILSAAFLVGCLLCAAGAWLVSLASDGNSTGTDSAASRGPLSEGAPRGTDGRPVGCRTDDTHTAVPTAPPGDVHWRKFEYGVVPVSPSAGPLRSDGPLLWCFAHTPMGAVMAAHIIPTQTDSTDWRAVVEQQVVAGTPRRLFVAMRETVSATARNGRSIGTYAGFAVASYTPDSARVQLLIRTAGDGVGTTYFTTYVTVAWTGGDWKAQPSTAGGLFTPVSGASDNRGFIMWGV